MKIFMVAPIGSYIGFGYGTLDDCRQTGGIFIFNNSSLHRARPIATYQDYLIVAFCDIISMRIAVEDVVVTFPRLLKQTRDVHTIVGMRAWQCTGHGAEGPTHSLGCLDLSRVTTLPRPSPSHCCTAASIHSKAPSASDASKILHHIDTPC